MSVPDLEYHAAVDSQLGVGRPTSSWAAATAAAAAAAASRASHAAAAGSARAAAWASGAREAFTRLAPSTQTLTRTGAAEGLTAPAAPPAAAPAAVPTAAAASMAAPTVPAPARAPAPLYLPSPQEEASEAEARRSGKGSRSTEQPAQAAPASRYGVSHRELLFGSKFGRPLAVNAKGRATAQLFAAHERAMLEQGNDELAEELQAKVAVLRDVGQEIHRETSNSNRALEAMNSGFNRAHELLRATSSRLRKVSEQSGSRHLCAMVSFILVVFVVFYLFVMLHRAGLAPAPMSGGAAATATGGALAGAP
mmetsp:Transcript_27648/g.86238  ORF Transcript_27648/g.86238 Transcript_27648/m.86238 type:complete len:309 (+) Transcript_27648:59-985(+)